MKPETAVERIFVIVTMVAMFGTVLALAAISLASRQ